ncbi:MAG: hypothetical protein WCC90_02170 [Methylocella sp.]
MRPNLETLRRAKLRDIGAGRNSSRRGLLRRRIVIEGTGIERPARRFLSRYLDIVILEIRPGE